MHKYFARKKITGLLALSLLFSSVPAWAAEDSTATAAETAVPSFYDLNFDANNFTPKTLYLKGQPIAFRAFDGCHYTARPVATYKEQLSIYIPEAYFQKKHVNGFNAKTAPIFVPLAAGNATEGTIMAPDFDEKPDYKNIKIMFKQLIISSNQQMDWKFDWEKNSNEMEEEEVEDDKEEE